MLKTETGNWNGCRLRRIDARLIGPGSQQMSDEQNWDALLAPQGLFKLCSYCIWFTSWCRWKPFNCVWWQHYHEAYLLFQGPKRWRNSLRRTSAQARTPRQSWRNACLPVDFSWFFSGLAKWFCQARIRKRPRLSRGRTARLPLRFLIRLFDLTASSDEDMHGITTMCPFRSLYRFD